MPNSWLSCALVATKMKGPPHLTCLSNLLAESAGPTEAQTVLKKILVVDDSPVDRMLVGRLLEQNSEWSVQFAEDGRLAIEAIDTMAKKEDGRLPDLVVTDLQMPYISGMELVNHLKQSHPSIPIVLITGFGSEQVAMDALRCGAANYTPKSGLQKDLQRTVSHVLEMSDRVRINQVHDQSCTEECQLAFVLENDQSLIGPLIEHLQTKLPKWSEPDRLQIGMALDEALVNAMHHGNLEVESSLRATGEPDEEDKYYSEIRTRKSKEPFCDRRVQVRASFSNRAIEIQVKDEGPGFDPEQVADPRSPENLTRVSGRGLFLIRTFMDAVTHNNAGNEITLQKNRKTV